MEWLRNPIDQTNPLKPVWTFDQIPDLSGKVIIVTGGNAEIGKESVQALLAHNATVYVASRSEEHAQSAIAELKEATGKEPIFLRLDLGNLSHIRKAAEEFLSKEKQLRVLMNNAGVMYPPTDQVTDGNFYMPFGTNVIAISISRSCSCPHSYLRRNLHRTSMLASSQSLHGGTNFGLVWNTRLSPMDRPGASAPRSICTTKGNVVAARELARRYGDQGTVPTSLHPDN